MLSRHRRLNSNRHFNSKIQKIASNQKIDSLLFGEDFGENSKLAKTLENTIKNMRTTETREEGDIRGSSNTDRGTAPGTAGRRTKQRKVNREDKSIDCVDSGLKITSFNIIFHHDTRQFDTFSHLKTKEQSLQTDLITFIKIMYAVVEFDESLDDGGLAIIFVGAQLKEQNKQILSLLNNLRSGIPEYCHLPADPPVTLSVNNLQHDIQCLEEYLSTPGNLSTLVIDCQLPITTEDLEKYACVDDVVAICEEPSDENILQNVIVNASGQDSDPDDDEPEEINPIFSLSEALKA
nr:unnamed protein product [Callosobruchus analis]